jgi:hypothetical protein
MLVPLARLGCTFERGLTLPSSGPPPAWPATFLLSMFHFAGQAGSGPLMSNVRATQNAYAICARAIATSR